MRILAKRKPLYLRNLIFGVEDSLVSTIGLLSGVAAAGIERKSVIIIGFVLIFVEALSMGVGSVLTEHSVETLEKNGEVPLKKSFVAGIIMFVSYVVAGLIPISSYIFISSASAFWLSIIFSLVALFLLGIFSSTTHKHKRILGRLRHGFEMFLLGGLVIFAGVVIGLLVKQI